MSVRLRFVVADEAVDRSSGDLWAAGALGIEERPHADGVELLATFTELPAPALIAGGEVVVEPSAPAARPFAEMSRVGPFVIVPPWHDEPADLAAGERMLVIDPGEAFGHGGHPTTRMAVEALVRIGPAGRRVVDVGCGSGVVAIAAAVLGAAGVVAIDDDPAAIDATRRNATTNGIGHLIEIVQADAVTGPHTADVAVVNVTIDVHERVAAAVDASTVIVGGVLDHQLERLRRAYPAHAVVEVTVEGAWRAAILERVDSGD